ncbi:MAG: hypothetical protein R6U87_07200 [Thiohalospira sp.]
MPTDQCHQNHDESTADVLHIALPAELLKRMLQRSELCAAELHCLDPESKRRVRAMILEVCKATCRGTGSIPDRIVDIDSHSHY